MPSVSSVTVEYMFLRLVTSVDGIFPGAERRATTWSWTSTRLCGPSGMEWVETATSAAPASQAG